MKRKAAKQQRSNSQKRTMARVRLFIVLIILDIALIVGTLLMLPTAFQTTDKDTGETKEWLSVESITVEGNTRYDEDAIIGISGIRIGQSVFSVNERKAAQNIRNEFAYAEDVTVKVSLKRHVTIRITEAEELGAVYIPGDAAKKQDGKWMVVSRSGVGLMTLPLESERPFRRLYLKGARIQGDEVGEQILDRNDLETSLELREAMALNGLTGVGEIDLSDRSNIRLNWKNQIIIAMGSNSNLTYEVAVAVSAIPTVLKRHGDTATGLLNLSQYSDEMVTSPVIVFTPSSILNAEKDKENNAENPDGEGGTTASATTTTKPR